MSEDVYRKLAQRLDAIPNGFSATESGVELQLLAKIFAPEQAALAAVMRLTPEPAPDIAGRAGVDPEMAYRTLREMVRHGLIRAERTKDQVTFGLRPFMIGIYELQLPRMDTELAELFEQYYQETQGCGAINDPPAFHRVIPVEEAIPVDVGIFSHQRASELLEGAKSWGVRDCICRVQQGLLGKGCEHPVELCLVFAPVEGAFDRSEVDRSLTKEEALGILRQAKEAGLVHTAGNYRDGHFYICSCCTCACAVLRGATEFGHLTAVAHSDFRSVVDVELCAGCGDCVEQCQFGALSVPEEVCVVDHSRCLGCGLCTAVCPAGALRLECLPKSEISPPPVDLQEWMIQRSRERGISLSDVM
jgi:ferredoxin